MEKNKRQARFISKLPGFADRTFNLHAEFTLQHAIIADKLNGEPGVIITGRRNAFCEVHTEGLNAEGAPATNQWTGLQGTSILREHTISAAEAA
jgi:hypothetical protein